MKDQELYNLTTSFILSTSIFATALSVAETDALKAGISIAGLILAGIWLFCSLEIKADIKRDLLYQKKSIKPVPRRVNLFVWIPLLPIVLWTISLKVHLPLVGKVTISEIQTLTSDVAELKSDISEMKSGLDTMERLIQETTNQSQIYKLMQSLDDRQIQLVNQQQQLIEILEKLSE